MTPTVSPFLRRRPKPVAKAEPKSDPKAEQKSEPVSPLFSPMAARSARHRELVLAHAENELATQGMDDEPGLIALYKKFLRIENHRLRLKHQAGGGGREIAQQRAVLVDIVLRHLYQAAEKLSGSQNSGCGVALAAIGGFGRGELCPCSDVDLMFLHDDCSHVPEQIGTLIEALLRTLWDVGFKVGHSTRSASEAIRQANADMQSKTSLLESRFIAGDRRLYDNFRAEFEKKCIQGHEKEYVAQRIENQRDRHTKAGGKITMQEPNVKNGCGSLRDYQNLIWVSIFTQHASSTAQLVAKKLLSESERRLLDRAYDFLLRVRTELHYHTKREIDTLNLIYQLPVATKLGYSQKSPLRRIEAFMRDYYMHSRNIFLITESTAAKFSLPGEPKRGVLSFLKRKKKRECFDGFYLADGMLFPETREVFKEDPFRMMRAFQHAQQRQAKFSPELEILVRRHLQLVDRTYCYSRAARETFEAIFSRKGEVGRIVRMMHEYNFLGKYIPEFAPMTCLVQHEFFHRYTADEHTLVCLEKLDELIDTTEERLLGYRELFKKIEDPFILYLTMLLHDVGKASVARYHAEASAMAASRVSARLQLSSGRRKMLLLLVDQHNLLSDTAQRRNIEDPATISEFADALHNQANLDMLMLITLADGMGVGDNAVWSDWKESLVWQLYRSASRYLADGEAFFAERAQRRQTILGAVLKRLGAPYAAEVEAHFEFMPENYFSTFEENAIASHIRLFHTFFEGRGTDGLAPAVRWVPHPDRGHSELWVCTWDRKNLLAKIAGALAIAHLNILSADIYTREDNLVFDIFRVCDTRFQAVTNAKDTQLVEATLGEALSREDFDFPQALQKAMGKKSQLLQEIDFPTRIGIDNDAHPIYTVVDIQTPDRLGLLYNILRGFGEAGLNIGLSRIATEKGGAIDSFYVTNAEGEKLKDGKSMERLQQLLEKATERARLQAMEAAKG